MVGSHLPIIGYPDSGVKSTGLYPQFRGAANGFFKNLKILDFEIPDSDE
jgi:hypothetical protein